MNVKTTIGCAMLVLAAGTARAAGDNELTEQEKADGWVLLFDGKSGDNWLVKKGTLKADNIQDGSINPLKSGAYIVFHEKKWGDFILACDFKVSKGCNSGIFIRTGNMGNPVQTGMEIQVLDSAGAENPGKHHCGALYDCMAPSSNPMRPAGEWNHMEITCNGPKVEVVLNGKRIIDANLDTWTEARKNPDGTKNKFRIPLKDFPREGYLGFQDHGKPVWFKNIKLKPLK